MRGIFYNSKKSLCSIWESGKMCYDALKQSDKYVLHYSEGTNLDNSYDFVIINYHHSVNNWITRESIIKYNKPNFCIVTEVTFNNNSPILLSPSFFQHYIVLDPTVTETKHIHAFGRPLEDFDILNINEEKNNSQEKNNEEEKNNSEENPNEEELEINDETEVSNIIEEVIINDEIPKIGSFGFATPGKEWCKIIEQVQNEFDNAKIHFNIPKGTNVPLNIHNQNIRDIYSKCKKIVTKPGILIRITSNNLSKNELIKMCSEKTINCFFYNRDHLYNAGLCAVTDQAISSGRPLLVTGDRTFRHIHKYIPHFPNISIKEAIKTTRSGVLQMKNDWSSSNFLLKFEKILNV